MNRILSVLKAVAVLLALAGVAHGQAAITLDSIGGVHYLDSIASGQQVTFYFRYTNMTGTNMIGIMNGYRIYSPDGGAWKSVRIDTTGLSNRQFDLVVMPMYRDTIDHTTPDTVAVGCAAMDSAGLPDGYDGTAVAITVDLSDGRAIGKRLCIDSSFILPAGVWRWVGDDYNDHNPSWDGPHCFYVRDMWAGVEPAATELPESPFLRQNYPNPFNPSTTIKFTLPRATRVTLSVTDILGREVITLVEKVVGPGDHSIVWDGRDRTGTSVAGGVYLYRLQAGERFETKKMVLVK
ncbi:MAG: T9SS type A sorting domain-containing protein [candidate division Zixibacteria bacterium]|nr:T9SS type A sorting domain-containing protein [candidate division Zixibacteria bacterium]